MATPVIRPPPRTPRPIQPARRTRGETVMTHLREGSRRQYATPTCRFPVRFGRYGTGATLVKGVWRQAVVGSSDVLRPNAQPSGATLAARHPAVQRAAARPAPAAGPAAAGRMAPAGRTAPRG